MTATTGEEGTVTNLDCGATYDWNTGLIYKNGNYFDPTLQIWLSFAPLVVWQAWNSQQKYHGKRGKRKWQLFILLILIVFTLVSCDSPPQPSTSTPEIVVCPPAPTPLPLVTPVPTTTLPPPLVTFISVSTSITTPLLTITLSPTATPLQPSQVSQAGLDFIARFEGFSPQLYEDSAGHCTVGFGHLVHFDACNATDPLEQPYINGISREEGLNLFRDDIGIYEQAVNNSVTVALAQHQYDALVSFAFNIGANGFQNSNLVIYLNQGDYDAVPEQMRLWTNFGDPGLTRRREFEITLFRDGIYRTDW